MTNFGPSSRGQPHSPDVNHCIFHFQPKGHWEPCSKVGSLNPTKHLVGFEPRTFRFLLQHLNPLGHSPSSSILYPFPYHFFKYLHEIVIQGIPWKRINDINHQIYSILLLLQPFLQFLTSSYHIPFSSSGQQKLLLQSPQQVCSS